MAQKKLLETKNGSILKKPATITSSKPASTVDQTRITIVVPIKTKPLKNPPVYTPSEKEENREIAIDGTEIFHSQISVTAFDDGEDTKLSISFLVQSKIPGTAGQ